ncbi:MULTISPECIES: DMT family transporter [Leclercia]|nr:MULTISPECIES: DMT family transporter [Leclercia]
MLAFAANSVLCRVALTSGYIDPATFSDVRIVSGALFLVILMSVRKKPASKIHYDWRSGLALTLYVLAMSWSYLRIDTGTGALLLFGTVQTAMVIYGWRQGEKVGVLKGAGLFLAVAGTVLLLLPGAHAPEPTSALMMIGSGLAWAYYSVKGKSMPEAIPATTGNFILAVPFTLILSLLPSVERFASAPGLLLAMTSGALASGAAYALWYTLLPRMKAMTASTVQLSVPCLATLGGVALLGETFSLRMLLSMCAVLLGILMVIRAGRA